MLKNDWKVYEEGGGWKEAVEEGKEVVTACFSGWLTTVYSEWTDLLFLPRALNTHKH